MYRRYGDAVCYLAELHSSSKQYTYVIVIVFMYQCKRFYMILLFTQILYKNIDQILPNKLHGPMYSKIGVTCVYNGHVFYTPV